MWALERSGGARAGKRTWGWLRVRRIRAFRCAACGHQSAAICKQGGGELGAHERSQVGQGERQGAAIPLLEGRTSEKRFRTRRRASDRDQPGGLFPWTPYLTPEPNVSVLEVVIQTVHAHAVSSSAYIYMADVDLQYDAMSEK